ncbi:RING finger protein 17 isoform X2 [Apis laboriosa]|nr:RING finger protein 17 isoform X2 [Apis laboriosa]
MLTEDNNENSFTIRNTCSERCNEPVGYYCQNCDISGCSHCMLRSHKTHIYQPLLKKNEEMLEEFYKIFDDVSENFKRIQQAQKKLKNISYSSIGTKNSDIVEGTVTQHFTYLHGILQNAEKQIIDSLRAHKNSRNKNIDEISTQLKEHEERLQSAIVVTTAITESLDKIDLQQIIQKLKPLTDIPCHLIQNNVPDDQEIKLHIDDNIIEAIKKHCSVQIPETTIFSLERKNSLPEDYVIEPLIEETSISKNKDKSMKNKTKATHPPKKKDNVLTVGSSEMIRITHVEDPSCFYVQLIQNQHKITELSKGLAVLANTTGTIPTEITLNALYIAQYSKNKIWYRARITDKKTISDDDERYSLLFIDYGMKEDNVPLIRIRNIMPQFAMLPVMALRCTLFDIVPNNGRWHPDATRAFKKLVCTNSMVSMCIQMITGDTYYVDLCAISSKDSGLISIKDSLTYMKYATCISPNRLMRINPDSTRKYYKEQLEMEIYTDVQVLFVESPNAIYVQKAHGNRSYFHKLIQEITDNYEKDMSEEYIATPCKDLPCAAPGVDGFWHRGLICEVTENTVQVFYVDLGYTLILSYDAIKPLPRKYMSCKTQAIKVSLRNVKPDDKNQWESETIEFIKKYLMDRKKFRVIPFNKIGDTYDVIMYTYDKINVANLLNKKNDVILYSNSSSLSTSMNKKSESKKNKFRKSASCTELPGELYDDPINLNTKTKNVDENEDPFKVCVLIHQVLSPDSIYVSDATCDQSDVEKMMKQMQEFYNKYRPAKRDVWNKDSACAVYFARSDMYYRGKIIDIKIDNKVVVFLYDIGIEETVSINDIQSLYPWFSKIPTYVFKIKLTGILPCGGSSTWPSLSCEKLHEIINNNQNSKFYISKLEEEETEDSAIPVELWIKQVKMDGPLAPTRHEINSVNRMLVEDGVALPVKEYAKKRDKILAIELKRQLVKKLERLTKYESNVKWFQINDDICDPITDKMIWDTVLHYSDSDSDSQNCTNMEKILDNIPSLPKLSSWLPVKTIEEDTFIAIPTYIDNNGFLYLHSKTQNVKILQYIELKLEKLYKNCPIESCDTVWAVGDLCIAQYHANKKWYRGKVVEIRENNIIDVEFIDYGNIEECTIGTLKKKVILEDIPIQCTKCVIYGLNPGNGTWMTEDLDRIHSLLIEQECEVTVLNKTKTHLVISLTILPNRQCNEKSDLIAFLINKWNMNINPNIEITISENSIFTIITSDVVTENSRSLCSDDDIIKDPIIRGNSVLLPLTNIVNENENDTITDVENISLCKLKNEIITSTPNIISEENLAMNYKFVNIPKDIDYIEIELCCSISPTKFYAQLKENSHSITLNEYYTQYKLLMNDLQENAYKQPLITNFIPNTPCCAKFNDDLWYRCLITESEPIVNSDNIVIKLLYVDYGNDEYRKINSQECELHILKEEWMDLPSIAIKCKLWNIKVASTADYNELVSQFQQKIYNRSVLAKIKDIDKEYMSVELYEDEKFENIIYNTLIEEGLFEIRKN